MYIVVVGMVAVAVIVILHSMVFVVLISFGLFSHLIFFFFKSSHQALRIQITFMLTGLVSDPIFPVASPPWFDVDGWMLA